MDLPKDNTRTPPDRLLVRPEEVGDYAAIDRVIRAAFGGPAEADLVTRLRADGDAKISLVAVLDDAVVGHVMLSRMRPPVKALGLAPLSVAPAQERRGIGSALMIAALDMVRTQPQWDAVFVLGDPPYYSRFGFSRAAAKLFRSRYQSPHFMALIVHPDRIKANAAVDYAPAFDALT
ncbi:GNAT family N-acetyltransferase [Acuticoccus kandeliae]|uniref:GNAT family N-acetyltransferase n=1 Tax=Acuticoccus kandeliae TaxID=2073160 RepID=UPI000D3E02F4|nr:N-acetyltransferase [Acuticoccus kandeliae]